MLAVQVQELLKHVDLDFLLADPEYAANPEKVEDDRQTIIAIHRGRWDYGFTEIQVCHQTHTPMHVVGALLWEIRATTARTYNASILV
jgi:hypothetical protein